MSVTIPTSYDLDVSGSFGAVGPVTLAGIPNSFSVSSIPTINVSGIPTSFSLGVTSLPKITLGVDSPVGLDISIKEIPSVRAHLPADYSVCFSLLGIELFAIRLCGESQVITEPYIPNPCERCNPIIVRPIPYPPGNPNAASV